MEFVKAENKSNYCLTTVKQQVHVLLLSQLHHKMGSNNVGLNFDPKEVALCKFDLCLTVQHQCR